MGKLAVRLLWPKGVVHLCIPRPSLEGMLQICKDIINFISKMFMYTYTLSNRRHTDNQDLRKGEIRDTEGILQGYNYKSRYVEVHEGVMGNGQHITSTMRKP